MRHTARDAFTLFELLLVIVLLAMLAAFAWPQFSRAREAEELEESARRTKTLIQMCRARAMNESRRYRIVFRTDGSLRVKRQRDPLYAPQEFHKFREPWAILPVVLERVWIEALLPLPEGPAPIDVEDELVEFEEYAEEEVIRVSDLEREVELDFEPDGTSNSVRWVLRDEDGRGLEMLLDGRLGSVTVETIARADADRLERPEPLEEDGDEVFDEDLEPLEQRP